MLSWALPMRFHPVTPLALLPLVGVMTIVAALASAGKAVDKRPAFERLKTDALDNAYKVTDKVWSGAAPESEASFAALHALGAKTVISVDGAQPDVETARRHGLRYVHLPIGYDEVSTEEGMAIARAIDELDGPIYVHCHHGKHRSAAAVAVACVMNGRLKPEQAESVLKTFGTGENYKGLWASALGARPIDQRELTAVKVDYREHAKPSTLVDAMVSIEKTFDHLKLAQKAGWRAPPEHPDLDPPHEALQLMEQLRELGRTDVIRSRPVRFRQLFHENEQAARRLHEALIRGKTSGPSGTAPPAWAEADALLGTTAASCTTCHRSFRDKRAVSR